MYQPFLTGHHIAKDRFVVRIDPIVRGLKDRVITEIERSLGPRDLIWIPAGIWRGVRNDGDIDVAFLTMLGAQKPELPTYPEGSPLTEARQRGGTDAKLNEKASR